MAQEKILVIEDEEDILDLLQYNLTREGFRVITADTGEKGLAIAQSESVDLLVLDLMLPEMNGFDVARRLRSDPSLASIPIIMLTAKGEEADILIGLEIGADDYVTKPFSPKVLAARIRAVLRRRKAVRAVDSDEIHIDDLHIHPGMRTVFVSGEPVDLTYTEFNILALLAGKPGWVFTRDQILDSVRGGDHFVTDRSVDVQITGLRKKLGHAGKTIETVRGVGYRFRGGQ